MYSYRCNWGTGRNRKGRTGYVSISGVGRSVGAVEQDHLSTWVMNLYNAMVAVRGAVGITKSEGVVTQNQVLIVKQDHLNT